MKETLRLSEQETHKLCITSKYKFLANTEFISHQLIQQITQISCHFTEVTLSAQICMCCILPTVFLCFLSHLQLSQQTVALHRFRR